MKITGLRSFMARDGVRPRVILAVDTDAGITGWAEAYNHGPDRALAPLFDYMFHQIAGEDPRRIERLHLKMLQHARFPPGALGLAAISAIDHALWDISAKALGVPVYQLLGGHVRDRVRVYLGVYSAPEAAQVRDHCAAACPNFKILEYRLPGSSAFLSKETPDTADEAGYVTDPYMPVDGHLELRPDRPGWGVGIDEAYLQTDRYIHWDRKLPMRPDGSTGYT